MELRWEAKGLFFVFYTEFKFQLYKIITYVQVEANFFPFFFFYT